MKSLALYLAVVLLGLVGCDSGTGNIKQLVIASENLVSLSDDFAGNHGMWHVQTGKWDFTDGVLRQTSTQDSYPLILRMDQQFSDLDISVDFRPVSGRIDASGGLVFRAVDSDNYYIVRANSLENNFRLYHFKDGRRSQLASAKVVPPGLSELHQLRVVAQDDHIQAYLNGHLLIDHQEPLFPRGYVGLWTKADSVTEFDNLQVVGN